MKEVLKIAIVVPGRFHAFDLARELSRQGHQITIFTNYPKWAIRKFDIGTSKTRRFVAHGLLLRLCDLIPQKCYMPFVERFFCKSFSRWASNAMRRERWDVIHSWSGVSKELFSNQIYKRTLKVLMRGSAHIRVQEKLLREEEERSNLKSDKPSHWMIEREEEEYELSDALHALSSFAADSFVERGVNQNKIWHIPLGVSLDAFESTPEVERRRKERAEKRLPLQILYVGAISVRKGIFDLIKIMKAMNRESVSFRIVGPLDPSVKHLVQDLRKYAKYDGKVPQSELPQVYFDADLFIFPTIEDGFGLVLSQAQAAGLPLIATTNCGARDIVAGGCGSFVLPIRQPEKFIEKIRDFQSLRNEKSIEWGRKKNLKIRGWNLVAEEFLRKCFQQINSYEAAQDHAAN